MKFQATSYELLSKCDCTWSLNLLKGFGTRLSGGPADATITGESIDYLTCNPFYMPTNSCHGAAVTPPAFVEFSGPAINTQTQC